MRVLFWVLLLLLLTFSSVQANSYVRLSWYTNSGCTGPTTVEHIMTGVCLPVSSNSSIQVTACTVGATSISIKLFDGSVACNGTGTTLSISTLGCVATPLDLHGLPYVQASCESSAPTPAAESVFLAQSEGACASTPVILYFEYGSGDCSPELDGSYSHWVCDYDHATHYSYSDSTCSNLLAVSQIPLGTCVNNMTATCQTPKSTRTFGQIKIFNGNDTTCSTQTQEYWAQAGGCYPFLQNGQYQLLTCDSTGLTQKVCTDNTCTSCRSGITIAASNLNTCVTSRPLGYDWTLSAACVSTTVPSFPSSATVNWYFGGGKNCVVADQLDYAIGTIPNVCQVDPTGQTPGSFKTSCVNEQFYPNSTFVRSYSDSACTSFHFIESSFPNEVNTCISPGTQITTCGTFTPFMKEPSTWVVEKAYGDSTCSSGSYAGLWAVASEACALSYGIPYTYLCTMFDNEPSYIYIGYNMMNCTEPNLNDFYYQPLDACLSDSLFSGISVHSQYECVSSLYPPFTSEPSTWGVASNDYCNGTITQYIQIPSSPNACTPSSLSGFVGTSCNSTTFTQTTYNDTNCKGFLQNSFMNISSCDTSFATYASFELYCSSSIPLPTIPTNPPTNPPGTTSPTGTSVQPSGASANGVQWFSMAFATFLIGVWCFQ